MVDEDQVVGVDHARPRRRNVAAASNGTGRHWRPPGGTGFLGLTDELWPWVIDRIRNFTLIDPSAKDLWQRVAGTKIQEQPFWADYDAHVKHCHRIVHRGDTASIDEARRSLDTAKAVIDYVERAIGATPPPAGPN